MPKGRLRTVSSLAALGLSAVISLAACGTSKPTATSPTSSPSTKNITIGFVPSLASDPFFVSMQYGAQQEADKLGVKLIWQGASGVYSPSAQIPFVNAVLADKPSAFILVPTDSSALMPSVQQAKSAGIPVITVDTTVTDTSVLTSHITGDNVGGGTLAAQLLGAAMGAKGQAYLMTGDPGVSTEELRQKGFLSGLKKLPGIKYLGYQYTKDEPSLAETEMQAVLSRYPNLGGVFAVDDTTAEGVILGLKNAGVLGKVKVVAYDAEPPEVAALRAGALTALVAQRPAVEGALAVLYAYDAVTHKTASIQHSVIVPDVLLKQSSLSQDTQWFYCTKLAACSTTWQPTSANGAP